VPLAKRIALHCPAGVPSNFAAFTQQLVADEVQFVGVVGPRCQEIEALIDDASVRAGSPERHFILTTSHPGESLLDPVDFAECLRGDYEGVVQVVEFS
jgi:hypothetical protein